MKRLLIVALLLVWGAQPALAFHESESFSEAGHGDGSFFTGSPRFKGYDCGICHTEAAGEISIDLKVNRPEFLEGRFSPNTGYSITVKLVGEHRGLESAFNPNTFFLELITDDGEAAGSFIPSGFPVITLDDSRLIGSEGTGEGETEWSFSWFSPRDPVGPVTLYLAMLDGDGADQVDTRWIDPLNDDVATMVLRLCPVDMDCEATDAPEQFASTAHCSMSSSKTPVSWLLIFAFAVLWRRTRRLRS